MTTSTPAELLRHTPEGARLRRYSPALGLFAADSAGHPLCVAGAACRLYDYARRRWLDYDGTPTTSAQRPAAAGTVPEARP
jgi:hypothetical protein